MRFFSGGMQADTLTVSIYVKNTVKIQEGSVGSPDPSSLERLPFFLSSPCILTQIQYSNDKFLA